MSLVIGSAKIAYRLYPSRTTPYTTHTFGGTTGTARVANAFDMVDVRGRKSEVATVLENLGHVGLLCRVWTPSVGRDALLAFNASAAWIAGHAYQVNDVVTVSGVTWECTTAGTSAKTGSGPTGSSPAADGTAVWTSFVADQTTPNADITRVSVWDIDLGDLVEDRYPESLLNPTMTHRDWIAAGEAAYPGAQPDPTLVLPDVRVRAVDAAALPEDVADVARSVKLGA